MPGSKPKTAVAKKSNVIKTDLLARAYIDILAREAGVNSKPMLRAGSGDPSDPVEILLDDLMDTPADGCSYGRARPVRLLVCRRGLATR